MAWTVFIDGKEGTTGLRIFDRLAERGEFSLLTLPEEKRKDADARREAIHAADIAILCLPDAAARESVALAEGSNTRILDTSTAHRVAPGWASCAVRFGSSASHTIYPAFPPFCSPRSGPYHTSFPGRCGCMLVPARFSSLSPPGESIFREFSTIAVPSSVDTVPTSAEIGRAHV